MFLWGGKQWKRNRERQGNSDAIRCDALVAVRVTERECSNWPEECEIVICLMFELPIQISLFRIHFVSWLIKCGTCQARFWINYWRAWLDNGDNTRCDIYLILPSSISAAVLQAEGYYANCSGQGSVCLLFCLFCLFFVFLFGLPILHFGRCMMRPDDTIFVASRSFLADSNVGLVCFH